MMQRFAIISSLLFLLTGEVFAQATPPMNFQSLGGASTIDGVKAPKDTVIVFESPTGQVCGCGKIQFDSSIQEFFTINCTNLGGTNVRAFIKADPNFCGNQSLFKGFPATIFLLSTKEGHETVPFVSGGSDFSKIWLEASTCVSTGTPETLCNGIDDDCDDLIDEDYVATTTTCGQGVCSAEGELACVDGKTQDTCAPETSGTELCEGSKDEDCDGQVDEGCGCTNGVTQTCGATETGECSFGQQTCIGGIFTACAGGQGPVTEICDGKDNDCDGSVDEALGQTTCGSGVCAHSVNKCVGGSPQTCNPMEGSSTEICDGQDNDCDGTVDESFTSTATNCGVGACAATGATSCVGGIIKDSCSAKTPAASDASCDGVDSDCDGQIDEDFVATATTCGQGVCSATGQLICAAGKTQNTCTPGTSSSEACDGKDNNCDGEIDDGFNIGIACSTGEGACAGTGVQVCRADTTDSECNASPQSNGTACSDGNACSANDACQDGICAGDTSAASVPCTVTNTNGCAETSTTTCKADTTGMECLPKNTITKNQCGTCGGPDLPNFGKSCDGTDTDQCKHGTFTCSGSGDALNCSNESATNIAEICDGSKDENCDGQVDENCQCTNGATQTCGATDTGECSFGQQTCVNGSFGDCVGDQGAVKEICDGKDNNCDGEIDESFNIGNDCTLGTGQCANTGKIACTSNTTSACNAQPKAPADVCNDGLTCTIDECANTADGCRHVPAEGLCVIDGACVTQGTVNPAKPCEACDTAKDNLGWSDLATGTACETATLCDQDTVCKEGVCGGPGKDCNDSNPCTTDSCDAGSGCKFTNNANVCDDADSCTASDTCVQGTCIGNILDADTDGTPDCTDGCDADPAKTEIGICGCGTPELDSDKDGAMDCVDACDDDPEKLTPGVCGCGVSEADTDGDDTPDCQDDCDNSKDSDGDGSDDCTDLCPSDGDKQAPGICGCGIADTNDDGDTKLNCEEACDTDPQKTDPGVCGCGTAETDSDKDGTPDCQDDCDNSLDTDGDGTKDCTDACPIDSEKIIPGDCGCGVADGDSDDDGALDCFETCDIDPDKKEPERCGCGFSEQDSDADGTPDCIDTCTSTGTAETICNGVDDDCDEALDEDYAPVTTSCGDGACAGSITTACVAGVEQSPSCEPVPDGTTCLDANICNGSETCLAGACTAGTALANCCAQNTDCSDGKICTQDVCDIATGACSNPPETIALACDDGDTCTDTDTCKVGTCQGTIIDSDNDNTADCSDACPLDSTKFADAGGCGCGTPDTDSDHDGVLVCNNDCNDNEPARFPGNPEICDGLDNDCNGQIDEINCDACANLLLASYPELTAENISAETEAHEQFKLTLKNFNQPHHFIELNDDTLAFIDADNHVYRMNRKTGAVERLRTSTGFRDWLASGNGAVMLTTDKIIGLGILNTDVADEVLVEVKAEDNLLGLLRDGGNIFAFNEHSLFQLKDGLKTVFSLPEGSTLSDLLFVQGNLLFINAQDQQIYRIKNVDSEPELYIDFKPTAAPEGAQPAPFELLNLKPGSKNIYGYDATNQQLFKAVILDEKGELKEQPEVSSVTDSLRSGFGEIKICNSIVGNQPDLPPAPAPEPEPEPEPELCNGKDDNSDGQIDEGFPDEDKDGVTACAGDCADDNSKRFPGNEEDCDGIDNNCDGVADENCDCLEDETASCGSDIGECKTGVITCANGQWPEECTPEQGPVTETCDGLDNDCDGQSDEADNGEAITKPAENQQGICASNKLECHDGQFEVSHDFIQPSAQEICGDELDNNCDGQVNEGCTIKRKIESPTQQTPDPIEETLPADEEAQATGVLSWGQSLAGGACSLQTQARLDWSVLFWLLVPIMIFTRRKNTPL